MRKAPPPKVWLLATTVIERTTLNTWCNQELFSTLTECDSVSVASTLA